MSKIIHLPNMSLSAAGKMPTIVQIDPTTDIARKLPFGILRSGSDRSYQQVSSSSYSTSQVQITCNPPSGAICVSRFVLVRMTCRFTFTGTSTGSNNLLAIGSTDSLRAWPISSCLTSLQCQLNNQSVSAPVADTLIVFQNVNADWSYLDGALSTSPVFPDNHQTYLETLATSRSPMNTMLSDSAHIPRGEFPITIVSNTPTAAVVEFTITEPLLVSPFLFAEPAAYAFVNLTQLEISLIFGNGINRMWSRINGSGSTVSPTTGITAEVLGASALLEYTQLSGLYTIPPVVQYSLCNNQRYITAGSSVAGNASSSIVVSQIQMNSCPRIIVIYIRRSAATSTILTPDVFQRIDSVSLNWGSRSGLLAGASIQQLYNISRKNGFIGAFPQAYSTLGYPLVLRVGCDISVEPGTAPGCLGVFTFQGTVNWTNLSSAAITCDCFVQTIHDGLMSMSLSGTVSQNAVLTPADVVASHKAADTIPFVPAGHMLGGGLFDTVAKYAREYGPGLLDAAASLHPATHALKTFITGPSKSLEAGPSAKAFNSAVLGSPQSISSSRAPAVRGRRVVARAPRLGLAKTSKAALLASARLGALKRKRPAARRRRMVGRGWSPPPNQDEDNLLSDSFSSEDDWYASADEESKEESKEAKELPLLTSCHAVAAAAEAETEASKPHIPLLSRCH